MTSDRTRSQEWSLPYGQAWVFPSHDRLVTPLVLVADVEDGPTDMAALVADLDHESYSFLSALHSADRDLVLLGHSDGDVGLVNNARTVTACVFRTIEARVGEAPLAVGGLGRGAVTARYSLARLEMERVNHETVTYFSYNGSVPSTVEAAQLDKLGRWPMRPLKLKTVSGEFKDELNDDDFDDNTVGDLSSGGALITQELGSWIIDKLTNTGRPASRSTRAGVALVVAAGQRLRR